MSLHRIVYRQKKFSSALALFIVEYFGNKYKYHIHRRDGRYSFKNSEFYDSLDECRSEGILDASIIQSQIDTGEFRHRFLTAYKPDENQHYDRKHYPHLFDNPE